MPSLIMNPIVLPKADSRIAVVIVSRLNMMMMMTRRGFGKKAKKGQQVDKEEEVPLKAIRPAAPAPVARYAVDVSKLEGSRAVTPKEIGLVMAEAVSDATLKQVLSQAAEEGRTDDDLFKALSNGNVDGNDHGSAHEVDRPLYRTVLEYSEIGIPYRTRPSAFFNIIIARAIAEMDSIDSKDIFSLWHTMCYLRIPWKMEEDRKRMAEEVVKRSSMMGAAELEDIIDAAYACSMMSLQALKEDGYQSSTLGPLVRVIISRIQDGVPDTWFMDDHRSAHRRLLLIRAHLRYCLRDDLYLPLSDEAKTVLRRVHRIDMNADSVVEKYPENAHPLRLPKFLTQLSQILRKLKVAHFVRARRGPFTFDILERDRRLIWECNNFDRYYGSSFDKLATRRLEERIIKAMGYRIVQVPFWHWRRVTLKSRRTDMIRMSRFIALRDFRERHMAKGDVDQYSDPTKFNARECALDSNSFQYIGENFFKAQKPSKAWMLSGAGLKLQKLPTRITM
ncbi:hypothetical protein Pmar_PMAR029454 [Perkinsus marinus ATCC 50983]|uniref:RAP domain-containing protein n=1 Tax=Perkinsus marinus (strain ATCC 50983 / TXsc) TaxID=423536 RepID=C5KGQ5_PERM5|nr:hypothetical protein Pmar_PMAR029454 [Perkinsus marinus ATCC 50983]EER16323.1 hypothetical protein Pmar_PMAR029454 [Perkinsus marinus ATCC 50983]|eukprot:XP_002784527.1 hypothetical protein Pmar_PMAR029454 [Perkinsus marinus ATCC 50983]